MHLSYSALQSRLDFRRLAVRCREPTRPSDFPRQINQRNDDSKRADDLADCTNRFPVQGMI